MKPPRIPNTAKKAADYPRPGSIEEIAAIENFGPDAMAQALQLFGPDNMGPAVAALCIGLGTLYRMITPIADFYQSPQKFAAACRAMIEESAALADDDDLAEPPD